MDAFMERMQVVVSGFMHLWLYQRSPARSLEISVPVSSGGPSPAAAAGGGSPCGGAGASVVVPERSFTMVLDNVTLDTRSAVAACFPESAESTVRSNNIYIARAAREAKFWAHGHVLAVF